MKKLMSGLLATTLAASFAVATVIPLNAAPNLRAQTESLRAQTESARSDAQTVQYQPWRKMGRHNDWGERRIDRRIDRLDRQANARSYRRGEDDNYYNGYRGYRDYRRGYREYNGFWFPAGAFIASALITGAINDAPRSGNSHVQWCYDHYRSYRAYDNTYQPYSGPRQQC
jgi:hypothetical protein